MADRFNTSVLQSLAKNVVLLSARITFGAAGAPTLDLTNPRTKGFCAISQFTTSFTATAASTASFTAVSNFTNLYNGMIISGTNIPANTTISAVNGPAGTFTASNASTGAVSAVTATGGYTLQFGTQAGVKLDTYVALLGFNHCWDMTGAAGAAAVTALAPNGSKLFLINNSISIATLAQISFITGSGDGSSFVNTQPASGSALILNFMLANSTAL